MRYMKLTVRYPWPSTDVGSRKMNAVSIASDAAPFIIMMDMALVCRERRVCGFVFGLDEESIL